MTRGQTYRIDLPETGLLSSLMLKFSAPSVSGLGLTGGAWRLLDYLGLIEIIGNGSTVIKSLQTKHLAFLQWLKQGNVPPHFWRNYATNTQYEYVPIYFGRFPGDATYGLDLSKWDNVELRVTNSATALTHGADISASIMQLFMRDVNAGFSGYLRGEVWREWTTVQDETKYFVLPTEFPFSTIALRALPAVTTGASNTGFSNLMDDVDFSIQGGTKRVYKGGLDDLVVMNHLEKGDELLTAGLADVNADSGIDVSIGRMWGHAAVSGSKDGAVSTVDVTETADETDNTIRFEAREADSPIEFLNVGMGFHNMSWLWNAPTLVPDELLDPRAAGEIRLNIHTRNAAASANGTNQVILERLVTG
jgi:hypothetical protein